ncbi:MafI family immunity protein [Streptomyces sp. NPDC055157]
MPTVDLSATLEFLEHNELELAFDWMVDLGDDLDLSLTFWRHLDRAAHEMRLYSEALHKPHLTAAELCRRHVAAASEKEQPAPGGPARSEPVSANVPVRSWKG